MTIGQYRYNLTISGQDYSNIDDISSNLIGSSPFIKLGIQAPMGTIARINGKDIMIGRTEIYESLPDVTVTSLYFPADLNPNLINVIIDYIY